LLTCHGVVSAERLAKHASEQVGACASEHLETLLARTSGNSAGNPDLPGPSESDLLIAAAAAALLAVAAAVSGARVPAAPARSCRAGGWVEGGDVETDGVQGCSDSEVKRGFTESQNHRMVGVGRDLCGSPSPTLLPKQGHLQQAAQHRVQVGLDSMGSEC